MTAQHNPNCAIVRMGDIRAWCDCERGNEQMNDNNIQPRWMAKLTYRHDDGPRSSLITFEEMIELHNIVECGPSFYSLISIEIIPSDRCPKVTVEEAMSQ